MPLLIILLGVLGGVLGSSGNARATEATPVGRWYAEGGAAQVEIGRCGDGLCGRVVWLRSPWDEFGCELRDRLNPDVTLRDRPLLGLEILRGLANAEAADGVWRGGTIYDPTSGRTYSCQASVDGADRLELRGYFGIPLLGRTTHWLRVGAEEQTCHMSHTSAVEAREDDR